MAVVLRQGCQGVARAASPYSLSLRRSLLATLPGRLLMHRWCTSQAVASWSVVGAACSPLQTTRSDVVAREADPRLTSAQACSRAARCWKCEDQAPARWAQQQNLGRHQPPPTGARADHLFSAKSPHRISASASLASVCQSLCQVDACCASSAWMLGRASLAAELPRNLCALSLMGFCPGV